jgi:hypothetical protein
MLEVLREEIHNNTKIAESAEYGGGLSMNHERFLS